MSHISPPKVVAKSDNSHNETQAKSQGQHDKDPTVADKPKKFPSSLSNPTEEEKQIWFTMGEAAGHKILKLKPELLPPPVDEGEPIFLIKKSTYKSQEQKKTVLVFEEDF